MIPGYGPNRITGGTGWSQAGDGDLGGVLDGEAVADGGRLAGVQGQVPGELAQVGLAGRLRAGLAEPPLDLAV